MTRQRSTGPLRPGCLAGLLTAILIASACSVTAPPIRHLQLSSGAVTSGSRDAPVVLIETVELPDYLLRDELATRIDDVTLRFDPYQRWAEPMDLAAHRVLAEHLGALLDTRHIVRFPDAPRSDAEWILRVRLLRFEREESRAVLSGEAIWARGAAPGDTVHSVTMEEQQALPGDASGTDAARALGDLLERFARAIASAQQNID